MFNGICAALLTPSSLATALIPGIKRRYMTFLNFLLTEQKVFYLLHPIGYPKYRTRLILFIFLVYMRLELAGKLIYA
ncbi:hypothetical protein CB17B2538 [Clostridium botulinum B str. Eklund 17B (NRP)]|nr:hypothetical protein CB17B2538 [Clostridium botulinum B str. Eklund 17B (NRP)]